MVFCFVSRLFFIVCISKWWYHLLRCLLKNLGIICGLMLSLTSSHLIRPCLVKLRTQAQWAACWSTHIFPFLDSMLFGELFSFSRSQRDFPGFAVVKNPPASAGDVGSIPGSGRSLGEGNGNLLQYSCLENFIDKEPGGPQSMGSQSLGHDRAHLNACTGLKYLIWKMG